MVQAPNLDKSTVSDYIFYRETALHADPSGRVPHRQKSDFLSVKRKGAYSKIHRLTPFSCLHSLQIPVSVVNLNFYEKILYLSLLLAGGLIFLSAAVADAPPNVLFIAVGNPEGKTNYENYLLNQKRRRYTQV
jgi:hypothetical protein